MWPPLVKRVLGRRSMHSQQQLLSLPLLQCNKWPVRTIQSHQPHSICQCASTEHFGALHSIKCCLGERTKPRKRKDLANVCGGHSHLTHRYSTALATRMTATIQTYYCSLIHLADAPSPHNAAIICNILIRRPAHSKFTCFALDLVIFLSLVAPRQEMDSLLRSRTFPQA